MEGVYGGEGGGHRVKGALRVRVRWEERKKEKEGEEGGRGGGVKVDSQEAHNGRKELQD